MVLILILEVCVADFALKEQSDVVAYAGVIELVASIPPYRWTIVTSASEKMMRSRLAAAGILAPKYTVVGDTVSVGKPNPEGYLRGGGILTRPPQECLVIEDAPAGVRAGKAAGCQVLAVASSHLPQDLREADWIVAGIDQIEISIDPETSTLNLKFPAIAKPAIAQRCVAGIGCLVPHSASATFRYIV
jgi:sugar-phosphatase